jgi:metal-dependent hydrolase (beta-lactamase superfamily II)
MCGCHFDNLKDKGFVLITGCALSGIIITIRQAQMVTGAKTIYVILGGFHLGFPGIPEEKSDRLSARCKR